ncbi:hypothetical protein FEZ33_01160 [Ruoffia tabacinasalis]|uniref:Phage protein n=1 Tax=Ruoffia tabacinasalis TaxID=87458 RepID=A0A5R9EGK6_9LACT|nr:hypothetical protein [Ruoffia tabacinasalis]TLQ49272.1 hypothetical protein FEZ33_01160 [Ruoffia tabacinasalis]
MQIDLNLIAMWAGAIATIWSMIRLVVTPFKNAITKNDQTMKSLEKAIDALTYDLKDSQKDREKIHKILDVHTRKIGDLEDDAIRNTERINTLFKQR